MEAVEADLLEDPSRAPLKRSRSKALCFQIRQIFLITLGAENRGGDDSRPAESKGAERFGKIFDDLPVQGWITNHAPLTHQSFSHLELGLDQTHYPARPLHKP